ncbi:RNA polymerase sigma factor [bacterium]|nr:RNA polymerase sigma factor [bacterium]
MERMPRTSFSAEHGTESPVERMFLQSYDDYANALFRHAVLRVRDRDLARDLVQETFTRVWDYLAKGKSIEHVRAFLYRTLNSALVDAMRKKRPVSLDQLAEDDGFDPPEEYTDPTPEVREEYRAALHMVNALDDRYKTPLLMRYVDGLSPKEIAALLGVTENVVSVRIHRGLKELRGSLRQ